MATPTTPTFKDKHGIFHDTEEDAAFANVCYSFMKYLTKADGLDLLVGDAENITTKLIESTAACGIVKAFIGAVEKHHNYHNKKHWD